MKKQIIALSLGFMSLGSFAQKKELKMAEKALKKNDFTTALSAINTAEPLIANADDKYKSKFYFLKGQVLAGQKKYTGAADAFSALKKLEEKTGKDRYTSKSIPMLNDMIKKTSDTALDLYNNKKDYKRASEKFYLVYKLSPTDTAFAYNAALSATQAKDYESAVKYYKELQRIGYTGIETQYVATNKKTGKLEAFPSKQQRDLMMKSGDYLKPETKTTESKTVAMVKNMALIYKKLGKTDEAITAFKKAREASPNDVSLILAEAYMYNDLKQPEKFEKLMKEAVSKDPNNPDLFYNIGVVNYNEKKGAEAIKYFKKAIELKSDYKNAHFMLANSMLFKDNELVEKMNALPASDMANYEKLQKERKQLFNDILPVVQKADNLNRNADSVRLLMGIYQQLEMDEKASEYKKILETLE